MTLRIELSKNATPEEREAILTPLRAYNASKAGATVSEQIALLVRNDPVSYTHLTLPTICSV